MELSTEELKAIQKLLVSSGSVNAIPLIAKLGAIITLRESQPVETGKTYRIECPGHWSHGKKVTVDGISKAGTTEFHSHDDVPGYAFLPVGCFKPLAEPIALVVGKTYLLTTSHQQKVGNVVVAKLAQDLSTAVVYPEGKPEQCFSCLCVHLQAVQP